MDETSQGTEKPKAEEPVVAAGPTSLLAGEPSPSEGPAPSGPDDDKGKCFVWLEELIFGFGEFSFEIWLAT